MIKVVTVFIFLLTKFVISTNDSCFEFSPNGDLIVKKGEEMLFRCSIKDKDNCNHDYNIKNIAIKKGSVPVSPDFIVYNETEKKVEIRISSATFGDAGTYICDTRTTGSAQSAVKVVHVGEPPSVPQNLQCLSRQMLDMICSFLMNEADYNIPTDWKMEFTRRSKNWITINESNCNYNNHTCWLNSGLNTPSSFTFWPNVSYQVRAFVWNRLGNATANVTIADTNSIVQPGPVKNLTYNYTTASENVSLQWTTAKKYIMLDYKILISSEFDNRTLMITNQTAVSQGIGLEDLIPFWEYSVSVYARPSAAELDIYWSTATTLQFRTKTAIPLHSVSMTAGSYVLLDCGQRNMCVVIYWKNPEKRYRYGLITGYNVTIRKYCFEETTSVPKNKHVCSHHQGDLDTSSEVITTKVVYGHLQTKLVKENNYLVEVMVKNSKGVSRNHSELMISNWNTDQAHKPIWVVAELTNNSAFISWQMYANFCAAVTSVTYYWCLEVVDGPDSFYVSCKDGFDWTKVNITGGCEALNDHSIRRPVASPGERYAVSMETDTVSGSLKWENFRFQKDNVPEKPLYRASADGTVLKVHIQYRDYHQSDGGKPDNYTIICEKCVSERDCTSDVSSGTTKTFPVDFLNNEYIVDNLKPATLYKVQVEASNDAGRSIRGKAVMITVPEDFKIKVVEIVVGTLTSVTCLALILLCCLGKRWYKNTRERMAITVPNQDETTLMMKAYYRSEKEHKSSAANDHDSGKASSSSEQLRQSSSNNEDSLSSTKSSELSSNLQNGIEDSNRNSQDILGHTHTGNATFLGHGEMTSQRDDENIDHERAEVFINNDFGNSCPVLFTDMIPIMTSDMRDSTTVNTTTTVTRETDATVLRCCNELSFLNLSTCKPFENTYISNDDDLKNKQLTTRQISFYSGYVDANHAIAVPQTNGTTDAVNSIAMPHTNSIADTLYAIAVPNADSSVNAVHSIAEPHANSSVDTAEPKADSFDAVRDIVVPNADCTIVQIMQSLNL